MGSQAGLLAGRYALTAPIAGGGMGQVWRGQDTLLGRPVAVKVLRDQFAEDASFLARFRAEARHAALLTHPHIAAVFDYGEVPGEAGGSPVAFLVMELVEGESLADLLAREGRLGAARTVDILRQAADGLAAAHAAGVVHRDVKPANLLVTPGGVVKITDFGIARSAASVAVTGTGQVIGTAHYFSPEQAAGGSATPASDVYALGTVGYECLAGRRPFEAENPVQIAVMHIRDVPPPLPEGIPAGVRALVERAMAKDPAARFPDGAAMSAAAAALVAGLPTSPSRPAATAVLPTVGPGTAPLPVPSTRPRARRPGRAALAWSATVLLPLAILAAVLLGRSDPPASGNAPAGTTPAGIVLAAEDYVGRHVRDVQAELLGRGLRVDVVPVERGDVPAGQVTAVAPTGTLAPDDLVQLSYAVPPVPIPVPAAPPVDQGAGDDGEGTAEEQRRRDEEPKRDEEQREQEAERKQEEQERERERKEEERERKEEEQENRD